jgi:hypothetical protein
MAEKKNIYDLNLKEFRKLLRDFGRTLYGKTVFFIAYFVPGLLFLAAIGFVICGFINPSDKMVYAIFGSIIGFVVTFLVGNMYYYKELRIFAEKR